MSGAGGSPFPYIFDALGDKYNLFVTDANPVIKLIYPDQRIITVPLVSQKNYAAVVRSLVKKHQIEYYIPLIDKEIPKALSLARKIPTLKVISPSLKFVQLCLNKYRLMRVLSQLGISRVDTKLATDLDQRIKFPLFLKPIASTGSRGAKKIINFDQLEAYFKLENYQRGEIMAQEYLEGDEYTVSVAVNNLNQLMAIVPKKIIVKKGITQHAVTEKNEFIENACRKIVEELQPAGPFNVQLRIANGEVKIFEINPRFSTTAILTCEAGVNEFDLCIRNYNSKSVKYIDDWKQGLHLFRRWESCFYES